MLLKVAKDAIHNGRQLRHRCRVKGGGLATKYRELDAELLAWWVLTKRQNKERVTKLRLVQTAAKMAEKGSLPASFEVHMWVERFLQPGANCFVGACGCRHRISFQAEKRITSKPEKHILAEVQKFYAFIHTIMSHPLLPPPLPADCLSVGGQEPRRWRRSTWQCHSLTVATFDQWTMAATSSSVSFRRTLTTHLPRCCAFRLLNRQRPFPHLSQVLL